MENKNIFTKILALAGTILAWLPIAAPIFFSAGAFFFRPVHLFRFDYLMPAEFFPLALVGGGLLLWAALRLPDPEGFPVQPSTRQADKLGSPGERPARKTFRASQRLIIWSLGSAVLLLALIMVVPVVTGLADGRTQPGGWQWALVLAMLVGYDLAVIALGVGGVLLLRDLFKTRLPKSP